MGREIDEKRFEDVMEILTYCRQIIAEIAQEMMRDTDECLENLDEDASLQRYRSRVQEAYAAYGLVGEKIDRLIGAMGRELEQAGEAASITKSI